MIRANRRGRRWIAPSLVNMHLDERSQDDLRRSAHFGMQQSLAFMSAPIRPRQPPSRSQVTSPSLTRRRSLEPCAHHSENKSPRRVRSGGRTALTRVSARGEGFVAKIRDGEQAQFALGLPALRREDPDAPALELLSTILGDGSASRLFLELREERGLVYDISASSVEYADAGAFIVSGGADPSKVIPALQLVTAALRRLAREVPSEGEIERARAYLAGRLERAADDPRGLAEWHASQRLLRRSPQELPDLLAEIMRVRPADLLRVARRLVKVGGFRVGLSAPRTTVAALRRAAARGDLDPSLLQPRTR